MSQLARSGAGPATDLRSPKPVVDLRGHTEPESEGGNRPSVPAPAAPSGGVRPAVESIVDVLLPNCTDAALDEIANTTFIDAGVPVTVTGVDQMLAALTRRLLAERALGGVAVVQLPRCRHRSALLLTVCCHLLCRQQPRPLTGPAVLVGFDVDLADQLRTLSVRNYRQMGLYSGNPLRAHRLTRDGSIEAIVGDASNVDGALIYYNTRIGAPAISTAAPLAIIDATSITGRDGRARALRWAADAGAATTVIVADLGDDSVTDLVTGLGHVPLIVTLTDTEAADLLATLGPVPAADSTLSSAHLLGWATPRVVVHPVGGVDVNGHVCRAWAAISHKPAGPLPNEVDLCARLLRNGTRLAARVDAYRSACTNNSRPGESPSRAVLRRLAGTHLRGEGAWRPWATGRWGALHHSVLVLWEMLEADNPKTRSLVADPGGRHQGDGREGADPLPQPRRRRGDPRNPPGRAAHPGPGGVVGEGLRPGDRGDVQGAVPRRILHHPDPHWGAAAVAVLPVRRGRSRRNPRARLRSGGRGAPPRREPLG